MRLSEADISRLHILARAIKVWFFTMLAGFLWVLFRENDQPDKAGEWLLLFSLFGVLLFLTFPVLYLTAVMLSCCSDIEKRTKKAIRLFMLTFLLNLIVHLFFYIVIGLVPFVVLLPFTMSSFVMMFLLNRDWFINKSQYER
jgi:hypothetical protein